MVRATRRGNIESNNSKRVILGKLDGNLPHKKNCQIVSNKSLLNTPKTNDKQSSTMISKPLPSNSKTFNCPVYKTVKPSPVNVRNNEDKLQLYDFEVDENEPVAKKKKRKPILKMGSKKFRTYKKKEKFNTVLAPINLSNLENICRNTARINKANLISSGSNCASANEKDNNTSTANMGPISNTSFCNEIDSSINSVVEATEPMLYSPMPYQSPKRGSLSVPVIRSSTSNINENEQPKSLNTSASSSKCCAAINSPFVAHFSTPMYLGSSTPIRSHWTEQTNAFANETDIENFDVSNFFGFDDNASVDEPFVSPIKRYTTPGKTPNRICGKPSPQKLSVKQVIRMLKYGPDVKDLSNVEDSQSIDVSSNHLPEDFFHTGESPEYDYSPGHSPPPPISLKMEMKSKFDKKKKKKKVMIMDPTADLEQTTDKSLKLDKTKHEDDVYRPKTRARSQFSKENSVLNKEDPVSHRTRNQKELEKINPDLEDELKCEKSIKMINKTKNNEAVYNRTTRSKSRNAKENNQASTTLNKENAVSFYSKKLKEDVINPEILNEVDIFGEKTIKKPRRSYERPEYLRKKKYYMDLLSESDDDEPAFVPEETNTMVKEPQRKRKAPSKKDEMELEKWAKAFNEQCMEVENFNLVVE